jgi:dUTP pyrophosphatase
MKIYLKKLDGVTIPQRGSELAAGYDIVATNEPKIVGEKQNSDDSGVYWKSIDYIEYETNLYIAPSAMTFHTLIHPRSSISKYNLVLANSIGLVDNDYRGMVICRFKYIWQPNDLLYVPQPIGANYVSGLVSARPNEDKIYKKGDKIAQLVFGQTVQVEFELVDELQTTQRGEGGFGSTETVKLERPKFPENWSGPNVPDNSSVAGSDTPITVSGIMERWLKKGEHAVPPATYETAVKEAEKNRS